MELDFKQRTAFLHFIEDIKKMKKKDFDKMMYHAWMNIWKSENTEEAWDIFEKSFLKKKQEEE